MDTLRGWADGRILVPYLSSVDVSFGRSLVQLFGCGDGKDLIFLLLAYSKLWWLRRVQREQSDLSVRCLSCFPVCTRLSTCVAHCKCQEWNDELSVWSQISAWLLLVCIESQQGGKMATPPKQKFCAEPHPQSPPPPRIPPQPRVSNNWWLPRASAQFTSLPLNFYTLWFKSNYNNSIIFLLCHRWLNAGSSVSVSAPQRCT